MTNRNTVRAQYRDDENNIYLSYVMVYGWNGTVGQAKISLCLDKKMASSSNSESIQRRLMYAICSHVSPQSNEYDVVKISTV